MSTDKPKRATTSVRTRNKGHQTNRKKKTAATTARGTTTMAMTRSNGKRKGALGLDPAPATTATVTANEDEILVVMYYHSPDEGPSPSNIFDCHICGQKFRVFPRIEQHYLKEHGCVVMKCEEDGKAEPRISCPDFPRTNVKQEQGQRTNPLTDFINKQKNKKNRKAEDKIEDAGAGTSPVQVKMEPIEVDIENIDISLPLEDDSDVVSVTKSGPAADSGEASSMSQSQPAEFKSSKPKGKAGWPKGKARPRRGKGAGQPPKKVAVVSPDGSKSPEPGLPGPLIASDTSSHSLSGTATPWEILQLNTPVPGKLRLKKGRPTVIATPATVASTSLVTSSSSGSSSSQAKLARDSRYAKRLAVKESGSQAPATGPRKLELISIKIEPEEYESSPRTEPKEEHPEEGEGLKEPEIEVMAETGPSAAELLVDDPAKHSQMEDQMANDKTIKMTHTEIENSVQHEPQENLVAVSLQPGMSTADNNCPTFPGIGDDVMLPEAVAVEDNDAELMEFLARESGFGGLNFASTNDSIDWSILDEFLEDNMPIRGPDSDYDPDLAMIAPDEAGLALVAAMCQSPLPPPHEENLPAEVKTPETENRKRKLAESTYNTGLLKGSHLHPVRPKKTKLNMEAAGNDPEESEDFDDTENLNPHPGGEDRDNYLKCSSADVMFSSTIVESPSKRLRMLQFQSSFDSDSDLSFIGFTSPKPNL